MRFRFIAIAGITILCSIGTRQLLYIVLSNSVWNNYIVVVQ